MVSYTFRTDRPLPGDAAYGPYRLALDPAETARYMRLAHIERAQVACDLVGGLWRGLGRLIGRLVPRHHDHGSFGGHLPSAR